MLFAVALSIVKLVQGAQHAAREAVGRKTPGTPAELAAGID
jgi:hypothetical protein